MKKFLTSLCLLLCTVATWGGKGQWPASYHYAARRHTADGSPPWRRARQLVHHPRRHFARAAKPCLLRSKSASQRHSGLHRPTGTYRSPAQRTGAGRHHCARPHSLLQQDGNSAPHGYQHRQEQPLLPSHRLAQSSRAARGVFRFHLYRRRSEEKF